MVTDSRAAAERAPDPAADQLRRELISLSAQEAYVLNLAFTRFLTAPEEIQISQLRTRSDALRARLAQTGQWATTAA